MVYTAVQAALTGRAAAVVQKCSRNREVASGLENKAILKQEIHTNSCWVWELMTGLVFCTVLWLFLLSELSWDPTSHFAVSNRPPQKSSLPFRHGVCCLKSFQ